MSEETSVNTSEVTEPTTDEGVKEPEVTEPTEDTAEQKDTATEEVERDFEKDKAFAEQRRLREAAERERDELKAQHEEQLRKSEHDANKQAAINEISRIGQLQGLTEDEIAELQEQAGEEFDTQAKIDQLESEKAALEQTNADLAVEQMMKSDLEALQKLDPNIKSIDDLGDTFLKLRTSTDENGEFIITPEQAYYAAKAYEGKLEETKPKAPEEPGFGDTSHGDKTFYTQEEVENMSQDEVMKHLKAINESSMRWNKGV